jgi:hypothetical protein
VIATLAATCPGRDVLIASTDRDYYQLLRDGGPDHGAVRVLNTAMRPGQAADRPGRGDRRYGITPAQYVAPPASSCALSRAWVHQRGALTLDACQARRAVEIT